MERAVSLEKAIAAYGGVQRALARRIDVPPQTLNNWKTCKRGLPRIGQILIARAGIEDKYDVWADKPKRGARRKKPA